MAHTRHAERSGAFEEQDDQARLGLGRVAYLRRTPHPVIVTIRDNEDYIRALFYSQYTTITGWGVLLTSIPRKPRLNPSIDPNGPK